MREFDIYGVFFHPLLIAALFAFPISMLVRKVIAKLGFYQYIWHPPLFDIALFVICVYANHRLLNFIS